jgi:hypothetical protein
MARHAEGLSDRLARTVSPELARRTPSCVRFMNPTPRELALDAMY